MRLFSKCVNDVCYFQEWVTDSPFVISPRITFEVSVRLLGGLMALGYSIAAILKRSSQMFCEENVCVKIDWLEQLNRRYIQVLSAISPSNELYQYHATLILSGLANK